MEFVFFMILGLLSLGEADACVFLFSFTVTQSVTEPGVFFMYCEAVFSYHGIWVALYLCWVGGGYGGGTFESDAVCHHY